MLINAIVQANNRPACKYPMPNPSDNKSQDAVPSAKVKSIVNQ